MTDKEKCISCGHQCCKFCGFTSDTMSGRSLEYYLSKGCKILKAQMNDLADPNRDAGELYRVYVPSVCPHLIEGEGCDCYDRRPLSCIEYMGKDDPLLMDVCKITGG